MAGSIKVALNLKLIQVKIGYDWKADIVSQ